MKLREAVQNRRIRMVLWMLVFLLSVLLPALVARGSDADMLWEKAVALAAKNADLFPGIIVQQEKVYMADGSIVQDSKTKLRLYDEDGTVGVDVISAVVNEKDITNKARRNLARSESEIDHTVEHPFMAEAQKNIHRTQLGVNEIINGRNCVKYSFSFIDKESGWEGETWIEKETGIPVQTKASLTTVPFVESNITIKALHTLTEYGSGPGDLWFPSRLSVEVKIEFENGAPGGKRADKSGPQNGTVKQELIFEGFWRLE